MAKYFRFLLLAGVIILLVRGEALAGAGEWRKSDMGVPAVQGAVQAGSAAEVSSYRIILRQSAFDPLKALPELPQNLAYDSTQAAQAGVYLVQMNGPITQEQKAALEQAGAWLADYIPEYAFLARLDVLANERVANLPFVRWVGAYHPAYKLAADISLTEARSYRVLLAPWTNQESLQQAQSLGSQGRQVAQGLIVELSPAEVQQLAWLPEVIWIEPLYLRKLYNDVGGGTIMGGATAWGQGYAGAGVTVAVADTGLDTGNAASIHQDFSGRVAQIASWPVVYANYGSGCAVTNAGVDDGAADTDSGHGSHVTGSVAGSGARSSGQFKGLAYQATIVFQATEQYTTWATPNSYCPNGYYLTGIPDDVGLLLNQAYQWGARVHNNSWGGGDYGVYDVQASDFDDFIYQHPDMLVLAAAGNDGVDANADGYVDLNSISSPATGKNLLTIGASDNERTSGGYAAYTWYGAWGNDYPANPTASDLISDDRNEMAAFSSRGPLNDNRIKPDLVAPGTNILSVRSSLAAEDGWGPYNTYYMYMGGTSMATPLTTGAAADVRHAYIQNGLANPSAALVKATLINTAVDISGYGNPAQEAGQPIPNMHEGWGRVNLAAAVNMTNRQVVDGAAGLTTGAVHTYHYLAVAGTPFKASLVWSDYPGSPAAGKALVNNLNLRLTAPDGATIYWGNRFRGGWSISGGSPDSTNNVENVYIQLPTAGIWKVEILGGNVPQGAQRYALVVSGAQLPNIPDLKVEKWADRNAVQPGSVLAYTIRLENHGLAAATGVVFTDTLPGGFVYQSLSPGCQGGPQVTGNQVVCRLSSALAASASLAYTLQVSVPAGLKGAFDNHVAVGGQQADLNNLDNQDDARVFVGLQQLFLPLVARFASPPGAPVLAPIDNADQDGAYTVAWSAGTGGTPTSYDLEENGLIILPDFAGTSANISGRTAGTYTYRVRAKNAAGASPWSAPQSATVQAVVGIQNGDFEKGGDGSWTENSAQGWALITNQLPAGLTAHSGSWLAWLGGDDSEISSITQQVTISPSAAHLTFWYWVDSADLCGYYDFAAVLVNGGALTTMDLCGNKNSSSWQQANLDLTVYAGQSVSLQFYVLTDSSYTSSLFVDDVALQP